MAGSGTKRFISYPLAALITILGVGILVGVGFLVWHKAPRHKCPVYSKAQTCDRYIELYGKESVCSGLWDDAKLSKKTESKEEKKPTGLRLNDTFAPYHYDVELWPIISGDFGFNGSATVFMTCRKSTSAITLHIDDLTVWNETIVIRDEVSRQVLSHTHTEEDKARQFYKIFLQRPLQVDRNYSASMSFNGTLIHPDWRGFYRSSYVENNQTHWLASTQFQRTHARRAFPCFDEPALKATFTMTIVRLRNYSSLSSMPQERSESRGGDWVADIYQKSVVMPVYLLAFVVSQFDYVETTGPKGLPMRIWSRPSFIKYSAYALNYTGPILQAFEEWTGIPYALPKLDQIAIPDYRAGAMENWGLITYRETALLYNPDYSDVSDRRWVASVVAHELAHQWWGNLVTCDWWDDTWLNEGFATYFGDEVGMVKAMPEYQMEEFFLRRVFYIMNKDGDAYSQPIYVANLEHHDDLMKAFDIITYYKGASVLRMIRYFLTERTFQGGIRKYLEKYKYQTTVHEDLYRELQKQAELDGTVTWDESKTNLSGILDTWVEQQNFPIINLTDPDVTGKVKVSQHHFLYNKEVNVSTPTTIGDKFMWDVPLTYASATQLKTNTMPNAITWLHRIDEMELPVTLQPNDWLLLNLYEQGFYRVKYGPKTWQAIIDQLIQDHTVIPVENRAGLLDDAFRLAQADELAEVEALRATQYLTKETEYLPFRSYVTRLAFYLDMFYGSPVYDAMETYALNRVLPSYSRVGWTVRDVGHEHLDRYTRIIVLSQACYRNYKPCIDQAQQLFEGFMNNPENDPIAPDLRGFVYCVGVERGGQREFDFMLSQHQRNYSDIYIAYQKSIVSDALECASNPHVIRRALDYALSQNSTSLFTGIITNRHAADTAWNYVSEHWDDFMVGNETRISRQSVISTVTASWHTEADLTKLEAFIQTHPDVDLERTYEDATQRIYDNIDWLRVNKDAIFNFLLAANGGNSTRNTATGNRRRRRRSPATDYEFNNPHHFADVHLKTEL